MKSIRKAIFPVAGNGTRFLPVTKAMPKELLPIIDKPLIQYAVEEAVSAGIDTLIFVTGRNKRAIEDHFDRNTELENILYKNGKNDQANMIKNILPSGVECIFVRQPEQLGLGDAILCAERAIGGEDFIVSLADDYLMPEGETVISDLLHAYKKNGQSQLSVMKIDGPEISNYGVVNPKPNSNNIQGIIEKPSFNEAPSNLATLGRYVLTADIFDMLRVSEPGFGGEIQLTDAINKLAQLGNVDMQVFKGERFDCGHVKGYLQANMQTAKNLGIID